MHGMLLRGGVILAVLLPSLGGCGGGDDLERPEVGASSHTVPDPDRLEVTQLAYGFMEALSDRDTKRLDEMMAPHARLFSIREGNDGVEYRVRTREEFLEGLAENGPEFVERIWEPVVEMKDRIGMVWAPYDFHVNGELTHCGIDVLAFLKMEEGWKVTSITYNLETEDCPVSPLGPAEG